jgi:hypothetical protein
MVSSFCLLALFLCAGCQSMTYTVDPEAGVSAGPATGQPVKNVEETRTAHYLFWGIAPLSKPSLADVAAENVGPGQVLTNVRIEEQNSFLDELGAVITLGIYRPRQVKITGQVCNK